MLFYTKPSKIKIQMFFSFIWVDGRGNSNKIHKIRIQYKNEI
ncbi:hypothetical protein NU09_1150 [Flavobacterium beibuense]|uniref:Uncharacterized protein n=1 Tax=Flavobacterium beibuense TaxID=657326 RepID=A0A444WFB3_9FLAO|nr:hypothetical protein NU09_1150 [Flavobacterium beibuense]